MINRYSGKCGGCRRTVAAGAGQAINRGEGWTTYHNECVPVRTPPPVGEHHGWHRLPLAAFDVETTSPEPVDARIVSAALVLADGTRFTWLVDPGVPIPPDATARNRITDDMVRAAGIPAAQAIGEIATAVGKQIADGTPLVAFCASYDVTVLHHELIRFGLPGLDWSDARIVDPFVLHNRVEPNWYDGKTLTDLCRYYGIELTDAHDALDDARATLELAQSIAARHRHIAELPVEQLHRAQVRWHREQALDLQRYYDRRGIDKTAHPEWPLETRRRQ
ncbi:exonuclease domain-containing protein [Micromonospora sp. NPDC049559]|uniref:exonuclease domain-containing protein n=1 Tax=Micromonospora sp. NPDC049559 TaxID=3155923 RepID=UPI003445B7E3